ncbi:MAG: hypothetical protein QM784_39080 [Polyangiaceae bacterium]
MKSPLIQNLGSLLCALPLALGCAGESSAETKDLVRSDDPSVTTSWQSKMKSYRVTYQDEAAVVASLKLDPSTRTETEPEINRVAYTTDNGVVDIWYDDGVDRPFHGVHFKRNSDFREPSWSNSSELRTKWERGARIASEYIQQLTQLTPVVLVDAGTDENYADALTDGYDFILTIDGWPVWVDDLRVRVDDHGIYSFDTDELPYDATENGTIDCHTQAEVLSLLAQKNATLASTFVDPPIFYGFMTDTATLSPFVFAMGSGEEARSFVVPLDRANTAW